MRRRSPRVEVLATLHGQIVAMDVPLVVRNMSAGGFGIESQVAFPAGAVHRFRFTAETGLRVVLSAQARHCEPVAMSDGVTRYRAGFEFVQVPGADTGKAIETLLEAATSILLLQ
jgi:hypothetical protein